MLASLLLVGAASLAAASGAQAAPVANEIPVWSVEMCFVDADGKRIAALDVPDVTVRDQQGATVAATCETPFVAGVTFRQNAERLIAEPVIALVAEGFRIDFSIMGINDQVANLELTVQHSKIDGSKIDCVTDDADGSSILAPQLETTYMRTARGLKLGEVTTIPLLVNGDPRSIELVVKRK